MILTSCSPAAPTFEQTFEGVTGVVLTATDGSVTITGADQTDALVTANASFSDPDQLDIRLDGGLLIVEQDCPTSCKVDYTLTVPMGVPIEVTTNDANVQVSDISAFVAITTQSGDAFARRIEGELVISTSTGQITGTQNRSRIAKVVAEIESVINLSFDSVIDSLVVETPEGDVTLQLAGGPYNLEIDQGSGSIDVKIETSESSSNQVTVRTGKGDIKIFQN